MRTAFAWLCGVLLVAPLAQATEPTGNARLPIVAPVSGTVSPTAGNACGAEEFGQTRRNPATGRMQICRPVAP